MGFFPRGVLERHLYFVLVLYLLLALSALSLIVKMTVHQMIVYYALLFLAGIVLTAYYLVRWPGQRMGWLHKEDQHLHERQPANAAKT
jgi:hypothetical protein